MLSRWDHNDTSQVNQVIPTTQEKAYYSEA